MKIRLLVSFILLLLLAVWIQVYAFRHPELTNTQLMIANPVPYIIIGVAWLSYFTYWFIKVFKSK